MKILQGTRAGSFREATLLAFREAGAGDMSPEVADLFAWSSYADKLGDEAEKSIGNAIRGRYRRNATWDDERWFIPVPHLRYDARELPQLVIQIRAHLVAATEVETARDYYSITLVGLVGKPETLVLPLSFLQSVLDDDLGRFQVIGKDETNTTWDVPSLKEAVRLPNDFLARLCNVLSRQSVAAWLEEFGSQGQSIAPLVVGTLLGLQFHGAAEALPMGQQMWRREIVMDTITQMFGKARAKEMFQRVGPYLKVNMTNEEAIRFILQEAGKEA